MLPINHAVNRTNFSSAPEADSEPGNEVRTLETRSAGIPGGREETRRVLNLVQLGFWAPSMAFLRRCQQAGIKTHLMPLSDPNIAGEATPRHMPSSALSSIGKSIPWGIEKSPQALEQVLQFIRSVQAEAISSDDEATLLWLARHRAELEPECRVMASPAIAIERLMQKSEQSAMAKDAGFSVLPTWLVAPGEDGSLVPDAGFPICVRPSRMNSVDPPFKAERIVDRGALNTFLGKLAWTSPLIAQPFCLGPNLVLHGVRRTDGTMLAMSCFRTICKHRGFALTIEPCELPEVVRQAAERFAALADVQGAFHFDLLQSADSGEVFFLEVNFRMGGTTAKVVRLGYDEPMLALAAFGLAAPNKPPELPRARRVTGTRMLTGRLLDSLLHPAGALDYPMSSRWGRFWSSAAQLVTVPDALFSWKDIRGSLWYLRRGGRM